jgi:hypothetical protein
MLSHVADLEQRIWCRCNSCGHDQVADPLAFAAFHDLDTGAPLLLIAERLVCKECVQRMAHCWPEPYSAPRWGLLAYLGSTRGNPEHRGRGLERFKVGASNQRSL